MWNQLGISWTQAAMVVVSTVSIYLTFILFVRVVGQRSLASMAGFDFGCAVALGSVLGRTSLASRPSLVTGILAMGTLFVTQGVLGVLREIQRVDRLLNSPAILLVAGRQVLHHNLRKAHITDDELRQKLRLAGIRTLDEVQCVVLERNGQVSVIREGAPITGDLVADVAGHQMLITST
jgi:uncharacterized membrane protein YcaP (DUF421 family)